MLRTRTLPVACSASDNALSRTFMVNINIFFAPSYILFLFFSFLPFSFVFFLFFRFLALFFFSFNFFLSAFFFLSFLYSFILFFFVFFYLCIFLLSLTAYSIILRSYSAELLLFSHLFFIIIIRRTSQIFVLVRYSLLLLHQSVRLHLGGVRIVISTSIPN
jgi:hypothetical protein